MTKSDKGVNQYSDVTHSVLFFQIYTSVSPFSCFNGYQKFANDFVLSGCFLTFGLLKYKGHDVTENRPYPWVFTSKLFNVAECGIPLSIFAKHLSIFADHASVHLRNTCHCIWKHVLVFLQNTFQYFCRKPLNMFPERLLVFLQKYLIVNPLNAKVVII